MPDKRRQRQGLFMLLGLLLLFGISCTHQATSGTYSTSNLSSFEHSVFRSLTGREQIRPITPPFSKTPEPGMIPCAKNPRRRAAPSRRLSAAV